VLPNIEPLERIDSHKYDLQPEALAGGLPQQEQYTPGCEGHHRRLTDRLEGSRIAQLEGRHRAIAVTH